MQPTSAPRRAFVAAFFLFAGVAAAAVALPVAMLGREVRCSCCNSPIATSISPAPTATPGTAGVRRGDVAPEL